jgi:cellulose synthase/poly-beta-1,6-N-acetylglucosamine synthase-like glycosyltransferase
MNTIANGNLNDMLSKELGLRSKRDALLFLYAFGTAFFIIALLIVPIYHHPQPVLDLTVPIYVISMVMTLIGVVWAGYAVMGLIVKPRSRRGNTFHGKFSIIVGAKDEERVIGGLINDILAQTYQNFEVVIVCHNCEDETYNTVKRIKDARIKPLELKGKSGKSVALNYGAKHSTGEIIVVFDADNHVPPDFLEKITHYFPQYDAVQSRIETKNSDFNMLTKLAELEFISFTDLFQITRSSVNLNTALGGTGEAIKREVIQNVGYWDEWALTEDFALFTKLTANKYKIGWCPDTYVLDEKIPWWSEFFKQRARWMKGHFQVAFRYAKLYWNRHVDLHYLIAPISVVGYYFTVLIWLLSIIQIPYSATFLPVWTWVVPWIIWNVGIAIRIYKRKGARSLLLFPLLFLYLYHWIAIFAYMLRVKTWAKTPHGFTTEHRQDVSLVVPETCELPACVQLQSSANS